MTFDSTTSRLEESLRRFYERKKPMLRPVERARTPAWIGIDTVRAARGGDDVRDGLVQPGRAASIATRIYQDFKGERLVVSHDSAKSFQVTHVYVGCLRVFPSLNHGGPILLEPFAVDIDALASVGNAAFDGTTLSLQLSLPDGLRKPEPSADVLGGLGGPFPMPVAQGGLDIFATFENIGKAPARLRGAFLGMNLL